MAKSNMELFILFAESFTAYQERWTKLFNGKLKLDELTNSRMRIVDKFSNVYSIKTKMKMAMDIMFYDHDDIIEYHNNYDRILRTDLIGVMDGMLEFMDPYLVGKIMTSLKSDPTFAGIWIDRYMMSLLFGKGSTDGFYLIMGNEEVMINFDGFYNDLMDRLQEYSSSLYRMFANDILLLEDYLCEFHMFYRLFENMHLVSHDDFIRMMNRNAVDEVELSEYVDSPLPYNEFQKQRIMKVVVGT